MTIGWEGQTGRRGAKRWMTLTSRGVCQTFTSMKGARGIYTVQSARTRIVSHVHNSFTAVVPPRLNLLVQSRCTFNRVTAVTYFRVSTSPELKKHAGWVATMVPRTY